MEPNAITRRTALTTLAGTTLSGALLGTSEADETKPQKAVPQKVLHQSVCRWCYGGMPLEALCKNAAEMGLLSVELLSEKEWATTKQHGITCAVSNGPSGIVDGWNRPADHDRLIKESERLLPLIADQKIPNMIVFSGNRRGISDDEGLVNCAKGLKQIMPLAEKLGVTVIMELLNSKRDHHDYQCDHTPWGVELCKRVGSDRFKLLYDIYHMQIMEGDVIDTIQENIAYLAHFHTGGVPGRNEIDQTQELNYKRVSQAILDTGFKGYFAHEFIPRRDPMTSLRQAVELCKMQGV